MYSSLKILNYIYIILYISQMLQKNLSIAFSALNTIWACYFEHSDSNLATAA